jgi:hypothetical protein
MWPQWVTGGLGVRGRLRGHGWLCGFGDALGGCGWPRGGHGWPFGVAGDFWELQLTSGVTNIACKIFKNSPNFRIKK